MPDADALADLIAELIDDHVRALLEPVRAENKTLKDLLTTLSQELITARQACDAATNKLFDPVEMVDLAVAKAISQINFPVAETDTVAIQKEIAAGIDRAVAELPPVEPIAPDMAAIEIMVAEQVITAVSAIPPVQPKEPDMAIIEQSIDAAISREVSRAVSEIPTVEPLAPDMGAMAELVANAVRDAVDALPKAKDGSDGVGLTAALIDRDGSLVLTMADGRIADVGRVVGKDGEHGIPFGPDDIGMDLMEDGRTLKMSFSKGDTAFEFDVHLPVPVYRGVWQEDAAYVDGDMVTWAGSAWHCNAEKATGKPGASPGEWTLAVKAGRPGRDKN